MPISVYVYPHQLCGPKFVDLIYQDKKVLSHLSISKVYTELQARKVARPRGFTRLCSGHHTSLGRQGLVAEPVFCICE